MPSKSKLIAKKYLFPGLDLHTRCRYRFLPQFIMEGDLETLDAGFGNGALTLAAYRRGNRVLAITNSNDEMEATTPLFDCMGIPQSRVEFRLMNFYELASLNRKFDQIICSEALEHVTRDHEVVQTFSDLLKPGGRLLLCCPNALHREHSQGRTNEPEDGRHVRDGYTFDSYKELLEPTGLKISQTIGLGSSLLCTVDRIERQVRNRFGDLSGLPFFFAALPFTWLDYLNPGTPFSVAVIAVKSRG